MILLNLVFLLSAFVSIVLVLSLAAWIHDVLVKIFKSREEPKAKLQKPHDWQPLPPSPAQQAKPVDENILTFRPILHTRPIPHTHSHSEAQQKAA